MIVCGCPITFSASRSLFLVTFLSAVCRMPQAWNVCLGLGFLLPLRNSTASASPHYLFFSSRPLLRLHMHRLIYRLLVNDRPQHRSKDRVSMPPAEPRFPLRFPHTRNPSRSRARDRIKCLALFHRLPLPRRSICHARSVNNTLALSDCFLSSGFSLLSVSFVSVCPDPIAAISLSCFLIADI